MSIDKRKPKFALDFVGFTNYRHSVDATLTVNPEYTLTGIIEIQRSEDSLRVITLIFSRRKKKLGRRGYSLKQEWEQKPQTDPAKKEGEK